MNSIKRRMCGASALVAGLTIGTTCAPSAPAFARATPSAGAAPPSSIMPGLPAATPMTDLLTRMDALETQVARLTAQNEELANRQHQLETKLTPAPTPAATLPPATPAAATISPQSANESNLSAMTGGATRAAAETHASGPARASAQRIAAVKAVIKPATGDAGLDEYSYGFRLYTAKLYPEAEQQLKLYIDKYPKDAHLSQARNLLGRAYLDDGKSHDAALWFLTNYKADPKGPRAADSLLNLAIAMHQLGDDTKACVALNEFAGTFAPEAQGRLRPDYTKTRSSLACN